MGTFVNSEDPDELLHVAAFHQGLHFLQRQNGSNTIFKKNYNLQQLNIYNGLS